MKPLLNNSEAATFAELNTIASKYGLQVNSKVRVADVLPIERSGISDDLYSYALMAHFDFVVTNEEHIPQFAVEFDGPVHELARAKARDGKKDEICRHFVFPLLHTKISYLPKLYRGGLNLLRWIIEVYHLEKAFDEAQANGQIPYDEPFDPFFIIMSDANGDSKRFPYWISVDANVSLEALHSQGKVATPRTTGFIGEHSDGTLKGIEYINVNATHGALVKMSMRAQLFPVNFSDLLRELLLVFVHDKNQEYLVSGVGLTPIAVIDRMMRLYQSRFKLLSSHGYSLM